MTVTSFNQGWGYRQPLGPFAAAQGGGAQLIPVTLPHDALRDEERTPDAPSKGGSAYYPRAAFSYLKTFDVPTAWAEKAVDLEFQGAFRHAVVFVNDEYAGNWADGYTRAFVDIKPFLHVGEANVIRVEVRAGQDSRWYSGCGLHRPVLLHLNGPIHIVPDGVRVTTISIEPDQAVVEVTTKVTNRTYSSTTETVSTVIATGGIDVEGDITPVTLSPGETSLVRQRFYLPDPQLWSVDQPNLYTARSSLTSETEIETTFGVRTIQVDPRNGLRINGETVLLRGACIHHDNGALGGAAIERAEERRIELLKEAGFNAIRSAHNPISVPMLDACDRLGMLVMDEAFDMWTRGKTNEDRSLDFSQWWRFDLDSLVAKDYNHPSVIMYSIGNEIVETGTPHGARLARQLAEHVRSLDSTRLVTNGVNVALAVLDEIGDPAAGVNAMMADPNNPFNKLSITDSATRRTAESSSVLDVVGFNYADGPYAMDRELFPHRIIVGSETFPSQIGRLWPMVKEFPHVVGDFTWTGWDYLGEVGYGATAYAEDPEATPSLEREFPYLTSWTGDIDITGWRRPVSYYREIVFGLRSEPYIAVRRPEHHDHTITMQSQWAWSDSVSAWTWPGYEDKPITVEVYADADEVALLLGGDEVTRAPVGDKAPMVAVLEAVYRPGELTAVAYRDGIEVGRTALSTAGEHDLAVSADRTTLRADDSDLAFVAIELRDADGNLVTCADVNVTVEVTGAGVLAGFCSANPKTIERFDATTRRTFDGRALAVIRPTPGPERVGSFEPGGRAVVQPGDGGGDITVTVTADGLTTATVQLLVSDD